MRESSWRITWDPAGASPRVLLDFGDLMDDEIERTLAQVVDIGRFDQAVNGRPYGRGNRKRRMTLARTREFGTAVEAWQAMLAAMASDPWASKGLLRVETLGGGSSFCRAALLSVQRTPLTLPFPGYQERLALRINGGLTATGSALTVTGGWYNPPVVGGGTTSGGITVIIGGTSTGLTPGDVVKVTGVGGVADGDYTVTGVSTTGSGSGGSTKVGIDAASQRTPTYEAGGVTGISQDGNVDLEFAGCALHVDGMTDGATYTYKINGVGPAAITPDVFGRKVISLGTRVSRISYHDWEHTALDPLPIDGNKHSPGLGPPDFLVEETGPSGWTVELFRNGVLVDSQSVVPSWSTSKSWDTGHPAADHVISGGGSVTFTLHGPGTVGSDRLDTGIAEPITGGTVRKLT